MHRIIPVLSYSGPNSLDYKESAGMINIKDVVNLFSEGLAKYRERSWERAISILDNIMSIDAEDGPSKVYLARCRSYLENEPSPHWDGVWDLAQ